MYVLRVYPPFLIYLSLVSLLDPSCSGSGIVNRMDYLVETGKQAPSRRFVCRTNTFFMPTEKVEDRFEENRLDNLASFQQNMIKHAMRCELPFRYLYVREY